MTAYPSAEWIAATDERFGERVRSVREGAGFSQEALAVMLRTRYGIGWHQTTVGRVEAGTRPAKVGEALAVAEALGVELAELVETPFSGDEASRRRAYVLVGRLSERQRDVQRLDDLVWELRKLGEGDEVNLGEVRDELAQLGDPAVDAFGPRQDGEVGDDGEHSAPA